LFLLALPVLLLRFQSFFVVVSTISHQANLCCRYFIKHLWT